MSKGSVVVANGSPGAASAHEQQPQDLSPEQQKREEERRELEKAEHFLNGVVNNGKNNQDGNNNRYQAFSRGSGNKQKQKGPRQNGTNSPNNTNMNGSNNYNGGGREHFEQRRTKRSGSGDTSSSNGKGGVYSGARAHSPGGQGVDAARVSSMAAMVDNSNSPKQQNNTAGGSRGFHNPHYGNSQYNRTTTHTPANRSMNSSSGQQQKSYPTPPPPVAGPPSSGLASVNQVKEKQSNSDHQYPEGGVNSQVPPNNMVQHQQPVIQPYIPPARLSTTMNSTTQQQQSMGVRSGPPFGAGMPLQLKPRTSYTNGGLSEGQNVGEQNYNMSNSQQQSSTMNQNQQHVNTTTLPPTTLMTEPSSPTESEQQFCDNWQAQCCATPEGVQGMIQDTGHMLQETIHSHIESLAGALINSKKEDLKRIDDLERENVELRAKSEELLNEVSKLKEAQSLNQSNQAKKSYSNVKQTKSNNNSPREHHPTPTNNQGQTSSEEVITTAQMRLQPKASSKEKQMFKQVLQGEMLEWTVSPPKSMKDLEESCGAVLEKHLLKDFEKEEEGLIYDWACSVYQSLDKSLNEDSEMSECSEGGGSMKIPVFPKEVGRKCVQAVVGENKEEDYQLLTLIGYGYPAVYSTFAQGGGSEETQEGVTLFVFRCRWDTFLPNIRVVAVRGGGSGETANKLPDTGESDVAV